MAAQNGGGGLLTIHSGMAPQYLSDCSSVMRGVVRLACEQFNRIVCVNEEIATSISRLGIIDSRLEVLPAYLPLPKPKAAVPADVEQWLSRHTPILSTALFFRPEYGFDLLVRALAELSPEYPDLGCLVMGDGDDRVAAEMLVERAGLNRVMCFAGNVDHELCRTLMSRSNAFVRPTLRDGDSISVREAISLGVPVVASNVGTRPSETVLFEVGSVRELVAQIRQVLNGEFQTKAIQSGTDTVERLLNLYDL